MNRPAKLYNAKDVMESNEKHANRDPLTGEAGSHPVATGIGAAVGVTAGVAAAAAIGAASGAALGPVGAFVGAFVGGVYGGGVGHAIGEDIFPTQLAWWKNNYASRAYVMKGVDYSNYEPAYWYGIDAGARTKDTTFENLEPSIQNNWNLARGNSTLEWDDARPAVHDAFMRMRDPKSFK